MSAAPAAPPRVVLLTLPTLFGATIINRLAEEPGIALEGIGFSARLVKNKGPLAGIHAFRKRVGWRYLLANGLEADLSWAILRMTGRPRGLKSLPAGRTRSLADVNAPESIAWLRSLSPDYILSYYFNQWIGDEVCAVAKRACLNIHPSLLPALRGPDPVFRALERGLKTTGVTIHEVSRQIDAGRVVHQEPRDVPAGASRFALYLNLIRDGADLGARYMAGSLPGSGPDGAAPAAGDYSTFPAPHEVREFLRSGHRLVGLAEWRRALASVR